MKRFNNLTKTEVYAILTGVFTATLIISNILAFKLFDFFGIFVVDCGLMVFPIVYIINDVLSEIYGFKKAKRVILQGFVMNLIAVIAYNIAIVMPYPAFFENQAAFQLVLSNGALILIASFTAYIVGSLLNSYVMVKMRERGGKSLMARCVISTLCGEFVDSVIFSTIAFALSIPFDALITMIIANTLLKTGYEIIIYPVTKCIITKMKSLKD